jgi:hypothetical protein
LIGLSIATRMCFKVSSILPKWLYENANFPISIKATWSFAIKCPLIVSGLFTVVSSSEWKFVVKRLQIALMDMGKLANQAQHSHLEAF